MRLMLCFVFGVCVMPLRTAPTLVSDRRLRKLWKC